MKLDAIDRRILRALQHDGRMPLTDLSRLIGLSEGSAHRRLQRLIDERVILGFEAVVDAAKTEGGLVVFTHVHLDPVHPSTVMHLKAAVKNHPSVVECHELAGRADFLIKSRVSDLGGYREFEAGLLGSLPGVQDVQAYPVIEEITGSPIP
jgi:Lrp/AsnC family leucine-responsive transcriptional regulator